MNNKQNEFNKMESVVDLENSSLNDKIRNTTKKEELLINPAQDKAILDSKKDSINNSLKIPAKPNNTKIFETVSYIDQLSKKNQQYTKIGLTPEEQESYNDRKAISEELGFKPETTLAYKYEKLTAPKRVNVNDVQQQDEYFQDENGNWKIRKGRVINYGTAQGIGSSSSFMNNYHIYLQQKHLEMGLSDAEKEEEVLRNNLFTQQVIANANTMAKYKGDFLTPFISNAIGTAFQEPITEDEFNKVKAENPELKDIDFIPGISKKFVYDKISAIKEGRRLRSQNPELYDKLMERQFGTGRPDALLDKGILFDRTNLPSWRVLKAMSADAAIGLGATGAIALLTGASFATAGASLVLIPAVIDLAKLVTKNVSIDNSDDFKARSIIADKEINTDKIKQHAINISYAGLGLAIAKGASKSPNPIIKVGSYLTALGLEIAPHIREGGSEQLFTEQLTEFNPSLTIQDKYEALEGMGKQLGYYDESTATPIKKELDTIITATGIGLIGGGIIKGSIKATKTISVTVKGAVSGTKKVYNFATGAGEKNATNPLNYVNSTQKEKEQIADIFNKQKYTDALNVATKIDNQKSLAGYYSESPLDRTIAEARISAERIRQTGTPMPNEVLEIITKNKSHEIHIPTSDGMETNISMPFYREKDGNIQHIIYENKLIETSITDNQKLISPVETEHLLRYKESLNDYLNHLKTFSKEQQPIQKSKKEWQLDTEQLSQRLKVEKEELLSLTKNISKKDIKNNPDIINKQNIIQEIMAEIESQRYKPYNLVDDENFYKTMFFEHNTHEGQVMLEALVGNTDLYKTYREVAMLLGKELEDNEILTIKPTDVNPYYLKAMEKKHAIAQIDEAVDLLQKELFDEDLIKNVSDYTSLLKENLKAEQEYNFYKILESENILPKKDIEKILGKTEQDLLDNIENSAKKLEEHADLKQKEMEDLLDMQEKTQQINEAKASEEHINNIKEMEKTKSSILDRVAAYTACVSA